MSELPDHGILHIYGQQFWHDDAVIIGDRRALELLRAQIDKALTEGVAANEGCDFFQSDGEGFPLYIAVASQDELDRLAGAYHDPDIQDHGVSPFEIVTARTSESEARKSGQLTLDGEGFATSAP